MSGAIDDELLRTNLPRLLTFVRVVERGSLSGAATDLGVTRPAVSQSLSALEASLGVRLLQRSTRGVKVTQAGERLHQAATELLTAARHAMGDATDAATRPTGTLRVACAGGLVARLLVVPAVEIVSRDHALDVEIQVSDQKVGIVESGIDVAVRVGLPVEEGLVVRRYRDLPQILVASPELSARCTSLDALRELPAIVHRVQPLDLVLTRGKERQPLRRRPRYSVDSVDVALELAIRGLGVTVVPSLYAAEALRNGTLLRLHPDWSIYDVLLYATIASRRHLPLRTRLFLSALETIASGPTRAARHT